MGTGDHLKLVDSKKAKPKRTYQGEPLECRPCNNRSLLPVYQPRYREGKVIKGNPMWMCPFCRKIVWP